MNSRILSFAFAGLLILIGNSLLALLMYSKDKQARSNRRFSVFFLSVAVYGLGFFLQALAASPAQEMVAIKILLLGTILLPVAFLHATYTFLNIPLSRGTLGTLYTTAFLFAGINIFTDQFAYHPVPKFGLRYVFEAGPLYPFIALFFAICAVVSVWHLFTAYRSSTGMARNRLKYLFVGLFVGFAGGSVGFTIGYDIDLFPLNPFSSYAVFVGNVIIGYAIIRYHLLDIRVAVTRAGLFLAIYTIVLGIPFYIAYQTGSGLFSVTLMFLLATAGPLGYRYLNRKAENILLVEQRRYQKVLLQAASGMAREHDLDRLLRLIVYVVDRTVRIEFAAIFLEDKEEGCYRLKAIRDHHKVPKNMTFGYDHPLIRQIKKRKEPIAQEEIAPILGEFMEKPVNMIVPSFTDDALTGMLFLGEKRNRHMYTEDDINIFKIMAHQTALAISNCMFMEEFRKSQEKLFAAEKLAAVGGMAEGVAHQIRNRLNQFSVAAGEMQLEIDDYAENHQQLIDSDPDLKKSLDYLKEISQSIVSNVKKTAGVINGVLNFANVEHQETRFSVFPLSEIIPHALELLCVKHQMAVFPLETHIDSDDKVYGVKSQVLECVYNILDNAYEAGKDKLQAPLSDEERKTFVPEIHMHIVQKDSSTLVKVSDNGIGIRDENKRKIFAPFFTTKPSVSSGTGIGLYVVKRMIEENHKGKIWFESEHLKGTTIYLELPRPQNGVKASELN